MNGNGNTADLPLSNQISHLKLTGSIEVMAEHNVKLVQHLHVFAVAYCTTVFRSPVRSDDAFTECESCDRSQCWNHWID